MTLNMKQKVVSIAAALSIIAALLAGQVALNQANLEPVILIAECNNVACPD